MIGAHFNCFEENSKWLTGETNECRKIVQKMPFYFSARKDEEKHCISAVSEIFSLFRPVAAAVIFFVRNTHVHFVNE